MIVEKGSGKLNHFRILTIVFGCMKSNKGNGITCFLFGIVKKKKVKASHANLFLFFFNYLFEEKIKKTILKKREKRI